MAAPRFRILEHPLAQHKLGLLRSRHTPMPEFRKLMRELGLFLAYEATRDLALSPVRIETPIEPMDAVCVGEDAIALISILRAGNGLLDGMLDLLPFAPVGHVGIYRDHTTLKPVEYFYKAPKELAGRLVIVADPMLATGNSAIAVLERLKEGGARRIKFACAVAAPEGVSALAQAHPDVEVHAVGLDRGLNEHAYIVPGLGDAGDRLYGTG